MRKGTGTAILSMVCAFVRSIMEWSERELGLDGDIKLLLKNTYPAIIPSHASNSNLGTYELAFARGA